MGNSRQFAIALSGGGYRASLFHLGALRRLNELGFLGDAERISSVSGGSILAGHLADRMIEKGQFRPQFDDWETIVAAPFRRFVGKDIRTKMFIRYFGWNAFFPKHRAKALADAMYHRLTKRRLGELPKSGNGTEFLFLATDIERAIMWQFGPREMSSYLLKKKLDSSKISIARAVAASACFPPIFGPIEFKTQDKSGSPLTAWLSDGGVYDNLGMEPVWKRRKYDLVMVSDGGATIDLKMPKYYVKRNLRYGSIAMDQVRALRQRMFIAKVKRERMRPNGFRGTIWRNASLRKSFQAEAESAGKQRIQAMMDKGWYGYDDNDEGTVVNYVSKIRTDLDRFTTAECKILENHGYFNADIALRTFYPQYLDDKRRPFTLPHGERRYTDEEEVRAALKHSHSVLSFWRRYRMR